MPKRELWQKFTSMHLSIHLSPFFPSHILILSIAFSLDALGSVSPGEMCHPLSDIPVVPGQPTSAPLWGGSGPCFPRGPSEAHLGAIISWLTQLISLSSGNRAFPAHSFHCSVFHGWFIWSIPLPVSHFTSSIDIAFDLCRRWKLMNPISFVHNTFTVFSMHWLYLCIFPHLFVNHCHPFCALKIMYLV